MYGVFLHMLLFNGAGALIIMMMMMMMRDRDRGRERRERIQQFNCPFTTAGKGRRVEQRQRIEQEAVWMQHGAFD